MSTSSLPGLSALNPTSSPSSLKSVELPRSPAVIPFPAPSRPHWIVRARRVYRFFDRPVATLVSYTALHVIFVTVWLALLGALSFLAMVLR